MLTNSPRVEPLIYHKIESNENEYLRVNSCICDLISSNNIEKICNISYNTSKGRIYLHQQENPKIMKDTELYNYVPIYHSQQCPNYIMKSQYTSFEILPCEFECRVIVSAIIMDKNQKVLILKKKNLSDHFPNCWMSPFGPVLRSIDKDKFETLEQALNRTLNQQLGIDIQNPQLICLYERVYPHDIQLGLPQSNELVFFFFAQLNDEQINFSSTLYDQAAWVHIVDLQIMNSRPDEIIEYIQLNKEDYKKKQSGIKKQYSNRLLKGRYVNDLGEGLGEDFECACNLVYLIIKQKQILI